MNDPTVPHAQYIGAVSLQVWKYVPQSSEPSAGTTCYVYRCPQRCEPKFRILL